MVIILFSKYHALT